MSILLSLHTLSMLLFHLAQHWYFSLGSVIPPDATLVFDVLLLDLWNKEDKVQIRMLHRQQKCKRTVMPTDFVRYHYNGSLLVGNVFESRWAKITNLTFWERNDRKQ